MEGSHFFGYSGALPAAALQTGVRMIPARGTGRPHHRERFMWILLLEAGTALALLLFILWWTLPRKTGKDNNDQTPEN